MTVAIATQGIVKRYGAKTALDGLDLRVDTGTVHAMLGPNGAGKTTTVDVLTTLARPDAGRAMVLGRDLLSDPVAVRGLVAVTGQRPTVDVTLTGRENLRLMATLAQLPWSRIRPRVDELLQDFGLTESADQPVRGYSGGMRRRLDLAVALVTDPAVLLLDEPTTGLDPHSRARLWDRIRALRDAGTTVVLTTQYLEEADQLADRVTVLDHGQVIADGTPAELKARLGETTVELHLPDRPSAERAREMLSGSGPLPASGAADTSVRLRAGPDTRHLIRVLRDLDGAALTPRSLSVREPTLDDVFLALTDGEGADRRTVPLRPAAAFEEASATSGPAPGRPRMGRDSLAMAARNLLILRRIPQQVVFATVQPIMIVLMFRYVLGGAMQAPGYEYVDYLMPGVFAQAIAFGAMGTAIGLAGDRQAGNLTRFLTLPMARSAIVLGRTVADLARNVVVVALMAGVGFAVGFRIHTSVPAFLAALGLLLAFGYALSWGAATLGLLLGDAESAQGAAVPLVFVLVFASSAFVPVESMPGWLQAFATHQPVTAVVSGARALSLGGPAVAHVTAAVAWTVGLAVMFSLLAAVRIRRSAG